MWRGRSLANHLSVHILSDCDYAVLTKELGEIADRQLRHVCSRPACAARHRLVPIFSDSDATAGKSDQ